MPLFPPTLLAIALPLTVYIIYILAAITSKPNPPKLLNSLPNISIVIPACNEESVLKDRINNLAEI